MSINKIVALVKKHASIRRKISGNAFRPRLAIFRSNQHIYAQIIDDIAQNTLVSSSTLDSDVKNLISTTQNCIAASIVGETIAKKSSALGIHKVVFDRGGRCS